MAVPLAELRESPELEEEEEKEEGRVELESVEFAHPVLLDKSRVELSAVLLKASPDDDCADTASSILALTQRTRQRRRTERMMMEEKDENRKKLEGLSVRGWKAKLLRVYYLKAMLCICNFLEKKTDSER